MKLLPIAIICTLFYAGSAAAIPAPASVGMSAADAQMMLLAKKKVGKAKKHKKRKKGKKYLGYPKKKKKKGKKRKNKKGFSRR